MGDAPVAHFQNGLSGSQTKRGACRSEGLVAGEHVPDRLGELSCEVDLRDLGAALAAEAPLGGLVREMSTAPPARPARTGRCCARRVPASTQLEPIG